MSSPKRHYPPMTSRQAKAAYRRSGGPRISEIEYKRILRGAELAERAAKIKEKERQKKINKRKREEKDAKEKERKKVCRREEGPGLAGKWKSSQRDIGDFLGLHKDTGKGDSASRRGSGGTKHAEIFDDQGDRKTVVHSVSKEKQVDTHKSYSSASKSPTNRDPLWHIHPNPQRAQAQIRKDTSWGQDSKELWDDEWTALLPSNTQVARELSVPEVSGLLTHDSTTRRAPSGQSTIQKSKVSLKDSIHRPWRDPQPTHPQALSDLLFVSTQDLQFSEEDLKELAAPTGKGNPVSLTTCIQDCPGTKTIHTPERKRQESRMVDIFHDRKTDMIAVENIPRSATARKQGVSPLRNVVQAYSGSESGLIGTQDLLELDLDLALGMPDMRQPLQATNVSFAFGNEEITDEELLSLDI